MRITVEIRVLTLLLVYTHDNYYFIPSYPDKLLNRTNTPSREFGQKDHSLDVVIFELFTARYHTERVCQICRDTFGEQDWLTSLT